MHDINEIVEPLRHEAEHQKQLCAERDVELFQRFLEIYDQKTLAEVLNHISPREWSREVINKWFNDKGTVRTLKDAEVKLLLKILPQKPSHYENPTFTFVDLFAGIGGIRSGFESVGGKCVFTSEWNKYAVKTYKANWYCEPSSHVFNEDIRDITLSNKEKFGFVSENKVIEHINKTMPDFNVLLAGFPCQPFSLAGVSKKNSLGRAHGFECETQGTLFFDVEMILRAKKPEFFLLENVKNLKSHDKGNTFRVIKETLNRLGYWVSDMDADGPNDPKIIDAKHFVPQHRERIVLVGFRKDLNIHSGFTLRDVYNYTPKSRPRFFEILDSEVDGKYRLTPKLWEYLFTYAKKHAAKGNGFGYGLVDPNKIDTVARTLSARYHKDGSEILVDDNGWDMSLAEIDFWNDLNQSNRPRRLTPRECSRLMGFDAPREANWKIPVSDTQAYRQFGNSVAVPVFSAVAKLMLPYIEKVVKTGQG